MVHNDDLKQSGITTSCRRITTTDLFLTCWWLIMSETEIEDILNKPKSNWTDEEVLKVFEHDLESIDEDPTARNLEKGDGAWNVSKDLLLRAAGGVNNALWRLGEEPVKRNLVKINGEGTEGRSYDERTELVQHELRTLEHELGRPPMEAEANTLTSYNKKIRRRAGIPYRPLAHKGQGLIEPEREEELVEMVFREGIDPSILTLNGSAHGKETESENKAYQYEVYQVIDKYSKWAGNETDDRDESISIDDEEEAKKAIIELIAERGLNQQQVIRELDVPRSSVDPVTSAMAERGYVEVDGEVGYRITPEGREAYLDGELADEIDVNVSLPDESEDEEIVDEFDRSFSSEKTFEVFELLGEGLRLGEIAEEMGENYSVVKHHAGKLRDQGLADETGVFTENGVKRVIALTDIGEEYHQELDQIEVNNQGSEPGSFSGEFRYKYTEEVFRLLGEGYQSQKNIGQELGASRTAVLNSIRELKTYDFVETKDGKGTWLSEEGEDVYEDQYGRRDKEEKPEKGLESLSEIPDMLTDDEGIQIISLLEDGNTIENVAILSDKSHASVKQYIRKYEEEGFIEREDGEIVMKEKGSEFYRMVEEELSQ